jgi:hypothetical protein
MLRKRSYMLGLKGHGNEADFLGFLQKLVPQRSLTLPFEPFRFWLRIRGDIRNRESLLKFLKFIIEFQHFKRLNQPFKGPI